MRLVNRAENWERAYQAFQQVNFAAWDYDTIKESMLDFMKLYYPEDFNDYIESSEFIVLLELFAYLGEQMAYRLDMNAHENFMSTAQRKESILRIAKLLSYNPSRNIPARGLVKLTTISTSERIFDANGNDLSNKTIRWNDPTNPNWKEQFILVMNRVMEQKFGSVAPDDRVQVQDVLFELYTIKNEPIDRNVVRYNASVSGQSYHMELVSVQLNSNGPLERRPEKNQRMNVLYLSDGLGDSSDNTGFFFFTKQGELQRKVVTFDGLTPNQTYDVKVPDSNETDIWLNNIDPTTGLIINTSEIGDSVRSGEWGRVDIANAQNVIFNTNPNRNKFEIETLTNDQFRLIFGDGKFADIPSGTFEIWFRTSANKDFVIPTTAIQNVASSLTYRDLNNKDNTFSFSFSLVDPIENAAPTEDIERTRKIAPAVYYTQDRMVNGRDYNEFMLQDNTILKLRAINRTFAGDSKYISWHDASSYYDNVKIFGNDGVIYLKTTVTTNHINSDDVPAKDGGNNTDLVNDILLNHLQTLLDTQAWFITAVMKGETPSAIRTSFNASEQARIRTALRLIINNTPSTIYLVYDVEDSNWVVNGSGVPPTGWTISATINSNDSWDISLAGQRLVFHSDEIKFWVTNDARNVITNDTLRVQRDEIVVLKANISTTGCRLDRNYTMSVLAQELIDIGLDSGLESVHDLHIVPADDDNDGLPDDVALSYLIGEEDYVYFSREDTNSVWEVQEATAGNVAAYLADEDGLWKRERGVYDINFLWMHRTPRYHLVDPSPSNIIDMFIITRGYYALLRMWLNGQLSRKPEPPTSLGLRNDYSHLLQNKMISDNVVIHPGKVKVIIGSLATDTLKGTIKVIRSENTNLTNNQIKTTIVDLVNEYFDIAKWEFGETFYFTELAAFIHNRLPVDIDSIVFVPKYANHVFGDLFQVSAREDEIIQPSISVADIEIVQSLNPRVLKQAS